MVIVQVITSNSTLSRAEKSNDDKIGVPTTTISVAGNVWREQGYENPMGDLRSILGAILAHTCAADVWFKWEDLSVWSYTVE